MSRIDINWDDLNSDETRGHVSQMQEVQAAPLVRSVGSEQPAKSVWYRNQILNMAVAGLLGGLLAWGFIEVLLSDDSGLDTTATNIIFTMMVGLAVGIVVASWEGVMARSWRKIGNSLKWAGPILLGTTLLAGIIANVVYTGWIDSIYDNAIDLAVANDWSESQFLEYVQGQYHLPRGVAWSIVGIGAGLGLGLASRQGQRILNGVLGGLIGGFAGGALFDFFTSGPAARVVGLAITGLAIGLAIGLVEVARRQNWLEILSGGMAGKQFILYSDKTAVGSSPNNEITLIKDPQIAPTHMYLVSAGNGLSVETANASYPTLVNGAPVAKQQLRDGDIVQLGSTMLRYRDKAAEQVVSGPIVG